VQAAWAREVGSASHESKTVERRHGMAYRRAKTGRKTVQGRQARKAGWQGKSSRQAL
jgi:hypothetical protein